MSSGSSAAAAVIIAAQQKRLMDQEEEEMTKYTSEDLNDWEFKILRANTAAFKNPYTLKKVIDEEAQNGWELLEKFDDARLRFKRKISHRNNDSKSVVDPYRTIYGISQWWVFVIIMAVTIFIVLAILIIALVSENA